MKADDRPLYDEIGSGYDATRRADPRIVERLFHHLRPVPGAAYVDVGCGTGNYTASLATRGGRWHGVELSWRMLEVARGKRAPVAWCKGDARSLPFQSGAFSGALCTLAIHHFDQLTCVFREVRRVLKEGRFVIFTATPEQMRGYWLNRYFFRAMEESIRRMPSLDLIRDTLDESGLRLCDTEPYEVDPHLQDCFLYSGKHRPEMYLSERVRRGMSTFASVADPEEIRTGCAQLDSDIKSGRIKSVIREYEHAGGDYLFVIVERAAGLTH